MMNIHPIYLKNNAMSPLSPINSIMSRDKMSLHRNEFFAIYIARTRNNKIRALNKQTTDNTKYLPNIRCNDMRVG